MPRLLALLPAAAAVLGGRAAGQTPFPLSSTTGDRTALEGTAPFLLPAGFDQTLVADVAGLSARGLPATFRSWDMLAVGPRARRVFVPCEVPAGAGVFRLDLLTGELGILLEGDGSGLRTEDPSLFAAGNGDYVRLDPATLTSTGSLLTGEESGGGRLFEILAPLGGEPRRAGPSLPGGPFQGAVRWLDRIPAVAHEGLRFGPSGELYFVDENASGSVYRFEPARPGDLTVGRTFVLSVDAFAATPGASASLAWDSLQNRGAPRTGSARWVALTDRLGNALTAADPFAYVRTTGGRSAADEVGGTPFGRPEDLAVGVLANGHPVLYVATTSENRVYSVELVAPRRAIVREFVNFDTINLATGEDVNPAQGDPYTSPGPNTETNFDHPDNLAVDAAGSVYVLEDENPGDVWKAFDVDGDGVAESMGIWASLGVAGSEPTGLIADPLDPKAFFVVVQHPSSGNDALWRITTP